MGDWFLQSEEAFLYYEQFIKCLWSAFLQVFSQPNRQLTSNVENEWARHDIKTVTDSSTSIFSSLKSCVFKFIFKYRCNSYHHLISIKSNHFIVAQSHTRAVFSQSLECLTIFLELKLHETHSVDSFPLYIAIFKAYMSYVNTLKKRVCLRSGEPKPRIITQCFLKTM